MKFNALKTAAALACSSACLSIAQTDPAPLMEAGAWEMRVRVFVKDEASGAEKLFNEVSTRFCFSPAFVAREPYLKPRIDRQKMEDRGMQCEMTEPQREANTVRWTMHCKLADGRVADSAMTNAVQARSFSTEVLAKVGSGSDSSTTRIATEGRRTGDCTADMQAL